MGILSAQRGSSYRRPFICSPTIRDPQRLDAESQVLLENGEDENNFVQIPLCCGFHHEGENGRFVLHVGDDVVGSVLRGELPRIREL